MSKKFVRREEYPEYIKQFGITVREIFPILCFMPEEIELFIRRFEHPFDDLMYLVKNEMGQTAFSRTSINPYGARMIQYIIPSIWSERYELIREAIAQIKAEFIKDNSERELVVRINEKVPSHNAYYAGMLPELGFEMQPRVTLTADQNLVERLSLPDLPQGVQEIEFSQERLFDFIDLYNRAIAVYEDELSNEKRSHQVKFRHWQLSDAAVREDAVNTWVGLELNGEIIGSCYGRIWDEEMSVEELAILPEFYGKGLGRFLTVRCIQKLKENYINSGKYFFVGTNRTYTRALKLYHRLGFKIDDVETYATFFNYDAPDSNIL